MKFLLAAGATAVVAALAALALVINLLLALIGALIQLLPYLLVLGAAIAVCVAVVRHRRGQATHTQEPAELRVAAPSLPEVPALPGADHSRRTLPALTTRRDRTYVVVGADTGFTAARGDGYLRLEGDRQLGASVSVPAGAEPAVRIGRSQNRYSSRRRTRP